MTEGEIPTLKEETYFNVQKMIIPNLVNIFWGGFQPH